MHTKHLVSLTLLIIATLSFADPAKMVKSDNLREKPFTDSKIMMALSSGQTVDIQKREGAWYQVKNGTKVGWTSMLSVHRTTAPASTSAGSLSKTATGRSATGGIVNTTGVRGLSASDLKTASFSESAVADLEKFRATADEATAYSVEANLKPQTVPSLDDNSTGGDR